MNVIALEKQWKHSSKFIQTILTCMPLYVKEASQYVQKKKGSFLYEKGDPIEYAIITLTGQVSVLNEFESGKLFEPVILQKEDFTGVVEIILGMNQVISSNVAITDVSYIQIPKKIFKRWLEENHQITLLVLESVSRNFRKNMTESGESVLLDSMYLLVSHILKFAIYDQSTKQYILQDTKERTSIRTGINVRTLYRHFKTLKQDGLLQTRYKEVFFTESQKRKLETLVQELRNK